MAELSNDEVEMEQQVGAAVAATCQDCSDQYDLGLKIIGAYYTDSETDLSRQMETQDDAGNWFIRAVLITLLAPEEMVSEGSDSDAPPFKLTYQIDIAVGFNPAAPADSDTLFRRIVMRLFRRFQRDTELGFDELSSKRLTLREAHDIVEFEKAGLAHYISYALAVEVHK